MTTAYIHVGLHKTGTTSLQRYFRNEKVIPYNPEPLFKWEENTVVPLPLKKKYFSDTLFIYEQLSWLSPDNCKKLIENIKCRFDTVKIILVSRNQQDLAISHKNQSVKSIAPGALLEREMYGLDYDTQSFGEPSYINIENHKEKWINAKCDDLLLLDFDYEFRKQKILNTLHDILRIPPPTCELEKTNESLPYAKYIVNTHIFKTEKNIKEIKKIIKEVNKIPFTYEKINHKEEIKANKGTIQIIDLFIKYIKTINKSKLSKNELNQLDLIIKKTKDTNEEKLLKKIRRTLEN